MKSNYYAVIMAGGVGSRFWPVSTSAFPKQFHDMLGTGRTLLQTTYDRFCKIVPPKNILVLTNDNYLDLVQEQLPDMDRGNILAEPAMRNTAPCILYAAMKIAASDPNAVMTVAPSDHWIEDEAVFVENISRCYHYCGDHEVLMTLGVQPEYPNTGYGYIQYDRDQAKEGFYKVMQFREKPDRETAVSYLAQGNFLWNAGIFIWHVKQIITAFEKYQPEMYALFAKGEKVYNTPEERGFIRANYHLAENISIDYAVMEPSDNIHVLPAAFKWNDLGTWGSLYQELISEKEKNAVVNAEVVLQEAEGNIIYGPKGKKIVLRGLSDFIVVDHGDTLLIYPREKDQEVKSLPAMFK